MFVVKKQNDKKYCGYLDFNNS